MNLVHSSMGVVTAATECLVIAEMRQGQDNWGANKYWDLEQAKREHCELMQDLVHGCSQVMDLVQSSTLPWSNFTKLFLPTMVPEVCMGCGYRAISAYDKVL